MEFLYSFQSDTPLNLKQVSEQENIPMEYISSDFGVVEIDLEDRLYAILVDDKWLEYLNSNDKDKAILFSNSKIETFEQE